MQKRVKRILSGMLCCLMLTSYSLSAYAAVCHHTSTVIDTEVFCKYSNVTASGHTETYDHTYNCSNCNTPIGGIDTKAFRTAHSFTKYEDLGHYGEYEDGTHTYRILCHCGYSQVVYIICNPSNGHATPF